MVSTNTLLAGAAALGVAEATGVTNITGGDSGGPSEDGGDGGASIPNIQLPAIEAPSVSLPDISLPSGAGGGGGQTGVPSSVQTLLTQQRQTIERLTEQTTSGGNGGGNNWNRYQSLLEMQNSGVTNPTTYTSQLPPWMKGNSQNGQNNGQNQTQGASNSGYDLHKQGASNPIKAVAEVGLEGSKWVGENPIMTAGLVAAPFTGGTSAVAAGAANELGADLATGKHGSPVNIMNNGPMWQGPDPLGLGGGSGSGGPVYRGPDPLNLGNGNLPFMSGGNGDGGNSSETVTVEPEGKTTYTGDTAPSPSDIKGLEVTQTETQDQTQKEKKADTSSDTEATGAPMRELVRKRKKAIYG